MVGLGQGYIDWYVTVTISNLVEQRHPNPFSILEMKKTSMRPTGGDAVI